MSTNERARAPALPVGRRARRALRAAAVIVVFAGSVLGGWGPPVQASTPISAEIIPEAALADIRTWLSRDVVLLSVRAQNRRHAELTQTDIDGLDKRWRSERESREQPLIARTLNNPLSLYLTQMQARSLGLYAEIFVMDAAGLNVGQSSVTSDYWQGDEDKWRKTFLVGPEAAFIDAVEFHEASATWRVQINLSIADPQTGRAVGAATVEVNLTELQRRLGAGLF